MKINLKFISLFIFVLFVVTLKADNHQDWWKEAKTALEKKEYSKALDIYKKIENNGKAGVGMYQNMALAAIGIHRDAEAILYLEKALKFAPNNPTIQENLRLIRNRHSEIDDAESENKIVSTFQYVAGLLGLHAWIVIGLLSIAGLCFWAYYFFPYKNLHQKAKYLLYTGVLVGVLSHVMAFCRHQNIYHHTYVIVTNPDTYLFVGPDVTSPKFGQIPTGSKVKFIDHLKDWWLVKNAYGEEGWMKALNGQKI